MAYLTAQDMMARFQFSELAQLTGSTVVEGEAMDSAIADTNAFIDGYLAGRYALPLDSVPEALTAYGCDIARHRLYRLAAPDTVRERYQAAVRYLEQLAVGKISLTVAGSAADVPDRSGPVIVSDAPVFGRGSRW